MPPLPRFTEGWQLGPPDLTVAMDEAFEVPARGPDIYRNFVVPLNLDRDTWVRAIEFRPSARTRRASQPVLSRCHRRVARARRRRSACPGSQVEWAAGESSAPAVVSVAAASRGCSAGVGRATRSTTILWLASRAVLEGGRWEGERSSCRPVWRSSSPGDPISSSRHTFIRPERSSARSRLSVSTSRRRRRRRPSPRSSCHQSSACSKGSTYRPTKGTTRSRTPS